MKPILQYIDIKTTVCDIPQYIITAQSDNEQYGTVSGSGKYAINSVVNLSANPKDGYECVGWYDNDNKLICDSEAYSLRVRDYKILYARFAPSSVIDTITSFSEDFENNANIFGISPNKKKSSLSICTPKVRHFWRCIFLWQRKGKNIENTRQNSNYLL